MLRPLKTSDIFKMSKILKKMNLKINTTTTDDDGKTITKPQAQVGSELIMSVFENLHLAENEVNKLLADVAGFTPTEFSELPIEKTFEIIKEFKNIPGLSGFFQSANQ